MAGLKYVCDTTERQVLCMDHMFGVLLITMLGSNNNTKEHISKIILKAYLQCNQFYNQRTNQRRPGSSPVHWVNKQLNSGLSYSNTRVEILTCVSKTKHVTGVIQWASDAGRKENATQVTLQWTGDPHLNTPWRKSFLVSQLPFFHTGILLFLF